MEQETLKVLEYEKIKEQLVAMATSARGKEWAQALTPKNSYEEVAQKLKETQEAVCVLEDSVPPFGGFFDLRGVLKKIKLGASLELSDVADILSTLYAMRNIKRFFKESKQEIPRLKAWAQEIEILGQLERNLENTIDERGNLRDEASVELRRIRRERRASETRLKEVLSNILHRTEYQKFFQEAIVTVRNERYVIPIKQEYRQQFSGIIHDQSASGATLFIEPLATVETNNDIKQLEIAEKQEIERILRTFSAQIAKVTEILAHNSDLLAELDFTFAKARLAKAMNAICPLLNDEGRTALYGARHPLIAPDEVVPMDLVLGEEYRMLLITGPNTGGKTVSMKTLGLCVCMAQSGLFLPVLGGSQLSVYHNLYADIGDEQSIEQSLSTFSSHMTHIVEILNKVERRDLLLFDEIGAGTDPEEGAALAIAILERMLSIGVSTIATTHYSELKTFAYTTEGIENACVEFDIKSLRPTYRILYGTPGASNAFAISRRLGLQESLVLRAQQLIAADHAQFEKVVNDLEREKLLYEQRNADMREREGRIKKLEEKIEATKTEIALKKTELIRKAKEQSAAIVRKTRRESEEIIDALKIQFDDFGIKKRQKAVQEAREKIKTAEERATPGIQWQAEMNKKIDLAKLAIGDMVYLTKLDQKGIVTAINGKELTVSLGALSAKVKANTCRFVAPSQGGVPTTKAKKNAFSSSLLTKTAHIGRELDLRGTLVEEAESLIGKFIDDAQLAGLSQILLIHGKGTGALRKGVHQYLKRNKSVENFAFADISEGGTGATVVDLH